MYAREAQGDYVDAALTTVLQIHLTRDGRGHWADEHEGGEGEGEGENGNGKEHSALGDILVFLTGQEEIESLASLLRERRRMLPAAAPDLQVRGLVLPV